MKIKKLRRIIRRAGEGFVRLGASASSHKLIRRGSAVAAIPLLVCRLQIKIPLYVRVELNKTTNERFPSCCPTEGPDSSRKKGPLFHNLGCLVAFLYYVDSLSEMVGIHLVTVEVVVFSLCIVVAFEH